MLEVNYAATRGGYVRAVFSRRVRGFAAPLALVRAQLKGAALGQRLREAGRQNAAMYERLADWANSYLFDDDWPDFVGRRAVHLRNVENWSWGLSGPSGQNVQAEEMREEFGFEVGGLDAPFFMAAGSVHRVEFEDSVAFCAPVLFTRYKGR